MPLANAVRWALVWSTILSPPVPRVSVCQVVVASYPYLGYAATSPSKVAHGIMGSKCAGGATASSSRMHDEQAAAAPKAALSPMNRRLDTPVAATPDIPLRRVGSRNPGPPGLLGGRIGDVSDEERHSVGTADDHERERSVRDERQR